MHHLHTDFLALWEKLHWAWTDRTSALIQALKVIIMIWLNLPCLLCHATLTKIFGDNFRAQTVWTMEFQKWFVVYTFPSKLSSRQNKKGSRQTWKQNTTFACNCQNNGRNESLQHPTWPILCICVRSGQVTAKTGSQVQRVIVCWWVLWWQMCSTLFWRFIRLKWHQHHNINWTQCPNIRQLQSVMSLKNRAVPVCKSDWNRIWRHKSDRSRICL